MYEINVKPYFGSIHSEKYIPQRNYMRDISYCMGNSSIEAMCELSVVEMSHTFQRVRKIN